MDVVEVGVMVEVDGRDSMDLGMEDIRKVLRILWTSPTRSLPILLPRLVLGLRWSRLLRKGCVPITLRWMFITLKL